MNQPAPDALNENEIRQELGEILDELNALSSDAFRERAALAARQTELRVALAEVLIPGSAEIKERWSDQAGDKPTEGEGGQVISPGVRS